MRRVFLRRVKEMIMQEPDTVFMTVDIGMWAIRDVLRDYPERCMNFGIFEDGMMSVAAGMASRGLVPTLFGIQPYLIERAFEQIKMELGYQKFGVNVVGTGAAVDYSKYGYSHYCAEDISLIKQIPGIEFIAPGTAREFEILFNACYRNRKSTFFRISDHPNNEEQPVEFGKAVVVQRGGRATVIAVSVMLDAVMEACRDKDVTVLYYTTLAPFDKATLKAECNTGRILVCEPHFAGSLDTDILQTFEGDKIQISHVGLPREIFRNYGSYDEKIAYYGLDAKHIEKKLRLLLEENEQNG